jgi:heptosyltransferase-1
MGATRSREGGAGVPSLRRRWEIYGITITMSLGSRLSAFTYRGIFRALARKRPPVARSINLGQTSRVLLFTCAGIGDTLTDSVVAKALRETYPGIHLGAVVHRRRRLLVEHNPHIDQMFLFHKGPFAFRRLAGELRAAGPWDAILQLRGNDPEPRCLSFLLDPDVTVSTPNMTHLSELCGHQVVQPDWDVTHGVEQTLRLARYVGADTRDSGLVYRVTPGESAALEEKLRVWQVGPRPRLVFQLGGGRRASWRDWPVTRYAELIRMAATLDAEIFVLGGSDQHDRQRLLETLFASGRLPYHDAVGRFTLAESAALLASARALVSTDTGIMHLGFAVGTRVVALIHCNNPDSRVGPYGYGGRHRVVQLPRPAAYRSPADADMRDIGAADVFERLSEIWSA